MPEYDIGYKKPPMKSRFKRGVSGNPKGRPKHKPLVLADIIRRVSTGRAMYHEKGRVKRVTRLELFIKTIVDRAMKGDITSAEHVLKFRAHAQRFGDAGIDRQIGCQTIPDKRPTKKLGISRQPAKQTPPTGGVNRRKTQKASHRSRSLDSGSEEVPTRSRFAVPELSLRPLHAGQARAYWALQRHRFKALRCGRRFGKTDFAKVWISQGLVQGFECAWFAPQHMTWSEVYVDLTDTLRPILDAGSKGAAVIRTRTGGRLDFWSMENSIAGRGRRYHRIVIDEATFTKDGDNRTDGSAMAIWEKGIKPTLYDFGGEALVCSNSAGQTPTIFSTTSALIPGSVFMNIMPQP
jgi:hypothetical protein